MVDEFAGSYRSTAFHRWCAGGHDYSYNWQQIVGPKVVISRQSPRGYLPLFQYEFAEQVERIGGGELYIAHPVEPE